jgi:NADP-dependent 3-hydroxy acid dehydrogenase YdfG
MNIQIKTQDGATTRPLAGRVSLVTGSTSGIGLGIARSLAAAGSQARAHGISRDQVIRDVLLEQQPNKRFADVSVLGALTVFLASDAAASISGMLEQR